MITFTFVFTFAMVLMVLIKFISILARTNISLPKIVPLTGIDPGSYFIFYPSLMYQTYFWFGYTGVLA